MTDFADISDFDRRLDAAWNGLLQPGAPFEIGLTDVRGVPMRTYVKAESSLRDLWFDSRKFAANDFCVFRDERLTYAQAHAVSASVAGWLHQQGLRAGDRVAIAMRNYPEWMLIYWACVSSGLTVVGLNAWWFADELGAALDGCAPKAIFCDSERQDRIAGWQSAHAETCAMVAVRTPPAAGSIAWAEVMATSAGYPDVVIDPDADACIFFTSGTSGRSKGARLTHRGCINTVMNLRFFLEVNARANAADAPSAPAAPLKVLATTPLFHVTANNGCAQPVATLGGTLVLMYKWDAQEALRLIEAEKITLVVGVPIMLREMLQHPDAAWRDISSLTGLSGGGAPMPPNFASWMGERPHLQLGTGFGMTETTGSIASITGEALRLRPDSCGRVMPTNDVKIVDDDDNVLPVGATGELCVRGPGVIPGYVGQLAAHCGPDQEQWMRTGDIARIDAEGYLYIIDRKKDMILRGGENVYCAEVEAAFLTNAAIAEACVFAVEDERLGEEVGVAVFFRPDTALTIQDLRDHVSGLLAHYKVPRHIWISAEPLPRNASGKFLRRALKESLMADTMSATANGGNR